MSRSFIFSELRRFLFVVQNRLEMGGTATEKQGEKSDFGQWGGRIPARRETPAAPNFPALHIAPL
jgi:hypothetical protein